MSGLNEYLEAKREAVRAQRQRVKSGAVEPRRVEARVRVQDRSGVRRIQIRDFRLMTDSGPETGGSKLGPSPVELFLGTFGGCLAHTLMIQAAARGVPLDAFEVGVSALSDPRAGHPGHPEVPVHPRDISYEVHVTSSASTETLEKLVAAAERVCPITSLPIEPQQVTGSLTHTQTDDVHLIANGAGQGVHASEG